MNCNYKAERKRKLWVKGKLENWKKTLLKIKNTTQNKRFNKELKITKNKFLLPK